ncbi:tyrosine phosphatase family-domain-containing protein [Paraphysoderma sedebokerense]|nr:tyrosine phosphatase family-domain-containing protein [Paraphysoderma sedebokerense]
MTSDSTKQHLPFLIPPFRYGAIEENLYRGAYPKQRNFRFLQRLNLKTILSLIPDPPRPELVSFCASQNIKLVHLRVDKPKENIPLTYAKAIQAVQILIDTHHSAPVFVHCLDGATVTGLVIMCLRKLQCWTVSSAIVEYLRYQRGGVISSEESEFIEKFTGEIEIPFITTYLPMQQPQTQTLQSGQNQKTESSGSSQTSSTVPPNQAVSVQSLPNPVPVSVTLSQPPSLVSTSTSQTQTQTQSTPIAIPVIPKWLWQGQILRKHPSLKLKLPPLPLQIQIPGQAPHSGESSDFQSPNTPSQSPYPHSLQQHYQNPQTIQTSSSTVPQPSKRISLNPDFIFPSDFQYLSNLNSLSGTHSQQPNNILVNPDGTGMNVSMGMGIGMGLPGSTAMTMQNDELSGLSGLAQLQSNMVGNNRNIGLGMGNNAGGYSDESDGEATVSRTVQALALEGLKD